MEPQGRCPVTAGVPNPDLLGIDPSSGKLKNLLSTSRLSASPSTLLRVWSVTLPHPDTGSTSLRVVTYGRFPVKLLFSRGVPVQIHG